MLARLGEYLRERTLLVVLDNCEHLVAACARLVDGLLRSCPGLQVLATSREPLGITGEVAWRVAPLPVSPPEDLPPLAELAAHDAIRLFVDRATAASREFGLVAANAPAVARVCWRLDGIPLAIELAAARVGPSRPSRSRRAWTTAFTCSPAAAARRSRASRPSGRRSTGATPC